MNSALTSTGVVPFMERFSNSTREVAQDGRRGALMLSISVKHPDAEHFIDAKMEAGKVTGANVSVKIDDEWVLAHRARGMSPDNPVLRGTAQNPDIFFTARETVNKYYDVAPGIVEEAMKRFAKIVCRQYGLFGYVGAPDAERQFLNCAVWRYHPTGHRFEVFAHGEFLGIRRVVRDLLHDLFLAHFTVGGDDPDPVLLIDRDPEGKIRHLRAG